MPTSHMSLPWPWNIFRVLKMRMQTKMVNQTRIQTRCLVTLAQVVWVVLLRIRYHRFLWEQMPEINLKLEPCTAMKVTMTISLASEKMIFSYFMATKEMVGTTDKTSEQSSELIFYTCSTTCLAKTKQWAIRFYTCNSSTCS